MKNLTLILCLFLVGCDNKPQPNPQPGPNHTEKSLYRPIIAVIVVRNDVVNGRQLPNQEKVPRSKCQVCKGLGYTMSGDGLMRVPCNNCYADQPSKPDGAKPRWRIFGNNQCCEDCICGENCECEYPGQCLVLKNRGWPVQVCDENECRQYYPRDAEGNSYDPYKTGVSRGEIKSNDSRYFKYRNPIPVDKNGNEVKNSSGCPSCRK